MKSWLLIALLLLAGCAGRTPNPVQMYQPGDDGLSCKGLRIQMGYCEEQIATLLPNSNKTASNVALGVVGVFLIFPWFFMDFSEADIIEVNAWRARNNYLTSLFVDKDCGIRMMMPSLKELQKDEKAREEWAQQVEKDQEFLHEQQSDNFEKLDKAYRESPENLKKQVDAMEASGEGKVLRLSEQEYAQAKDRLLSLYTTGAIDKSDFDRELKELDDAKAAYKSTPVENAEEEN